MDFPPLHLVLPSLADTFGNPITLQNDDNLPMLPKLIHFSERTSTPVETYTVYSAQTNFRFSFYGSFSPRVFSVPSFPNDEARWIQGPAQRFPARLLSNTVTLILRDFEDLQGLFPLVPIDAATPINSLLNHDVRLPQQLARNSLVSPVVKTIYLISESFTNFIYPNDLMPHIVTNVEQALKQFPNLHTLHLPDPLNLQPDVTNDDMFVVIYKEAVKELSRHSLASIRGLTVVMDQDFWIESSNLSRLKALD